MKRILIAAVLLSAALPSAAQRNTGYYEDYVQYLPLAMYVGLVLTDNDNPDRFTDLLISGSLSYVTEALAVNSLKLIVNEKRPNGTTNNSVPSGHTATAFTAAELVRLEKGWGWGAGAYAAASLVAYARAAHQCHWWWDSAAGAAIGILSANLGYRCTRPIKRAFGWELPREALVSFHPDINPYTRTACASISLVF